MKCIGNIEKKIAAKEPVIGVHAKWNCSTAVDVMCHGGIDYVWIDGEHGFMSEETLSEYVRVCQANDVAAFYRVAWSDHGLCKRPLDIGVDGIIFPMINNADLAKRAVQSVHYPPLGTRSFGPGMCMDYGTMNFDEFVEKSRKVWTIIQIEHVEAVKNIDAILDVEGINGVIVGMYDLSASMGIMAQLDHPALLEQLDLIAEKCKIAGIPFGSSISYSEILLNQWFRRGAAFMTIGGDQDFLMDGVTQTVKGASRIFQSYLK